MFGERRFGILAAIFLLASAICGKAQTASSAATAANRQVYAVRGVVKELPSDGKTVVVQHEAVTNYMPAMTMPFEVRDTNELRGLRIGDAIAFQMIVAGADAWIERIMKTNAPPAAETHPRMSFHLVRDVDLLGVGDTLPEYHFTNELGRAITTKQFSGQAFAFTFFFTRCPYPTFCPLMSRNFEETQERLLAMRNAPTNWHLISISFDTDNDSPAQLKDYAARYDYRPARWSFVTGDPIEITAIGDQVGEYFGHDESGGVTHNLRTVVVDTRGRIQKIFTDNKWTSEELVAELVKAAQVKR